MENRYFYDFCSKIVNSKTDEELMSWLNFHKYKELQQEVYKTLKKHYWGNLNGELKNKIDIFFIEINQ